MAWIAFSDLIELICTTAGCDFINSALVFDVVDGFDYVYPDASRSYLSTLAVLQLDAILTNAKIVSTVGSKNNGNQKPFEKMIIMKYDCVGIGLIKMTVGVRRRTHEKVQYCIIICLKNAQRMFTDWWGSGRGLGTKRNTPSYLRLISRCKGIYFIVMCK